MFGSPPAHPRVPRRGIGATRMHKNPNALNLAHVADREPGHAHADAEGFGLAGLGDGADCPSLADHDERAARRRPSGTFSFEKINGECLSKSCGILRSTFPDDKHVPPGGLQSLGNPSVPLPVAGNLHRPELDVGLRKRPSSAIGMPVPIASVNEDCDPPACQNDVRPARKVRPIETITNPEFAQGTSDGHLRRRVTPFDAAHQRRAAGRIQKFVHQITLACPIPTVRAFTDWRRVPAPQKAGWTYGNTEMPPDACRNLAQSTLALGVWSARPSFRLRGQAQGETAPR